MKKRIIYVVENSKDAQYRYRVANLNELMDMSKDWCMDILLRQHMRLSDIAGSRLIVIERQTAKNGRILDFIKEAKRLGIRVLFDIDDLVFDYRDLKLVVDTVGEKNALYWLGYFWGVRRIAKKVDGFLTTNDFLGRKLERSFGRPYRVILNSLNKRQIEVSERCLGKKVHDGFRIGYFSGSPTHMKDFRLVEPEIIDFLEKYDDARLMVVGYMKFSKEMQRMINTGKVEVLESVNYLKLQELIAGVDVNIAPLIINDFTNCKSELKFFEAAIAETTTIASPTYAFKKAIKDGENGFLAQPGEWCGKLEHLYGHPDENKRIAKEAKEYVLRHYYGKKFLKEVEAAYGYFVQ